MEAAEQLFTPWMTSTSDGVDHAVTDEEFTERRPEPESVCGVVVLLGPLEQAPGPRCPRCVAFLKARATLPTRERRLDVHRHQRPGWLARFRHVTMSPVVPRPRAGARRDRPEPRAGMWPNLVPDAETTQPSAAAPAGHHGAQP
jgi:hypothetical protein